MISNGPPVIMLGEDDTMLEFGTIVAEERSRLCKRAIACNRESSICESEVRANMAAMALFYVEITQFFGFYFYFLFSGGGGSSPRISAADFKFFRKSNVVHAHLLFFLKQVRAPI